MDIVERLRTNQCKENAGCNPPLCVCGLMDDAADEIERLREALEEIMHYDIQIHGLQTRDGPCAVLARAALKESE